MHHWVDLSPWGHGKSYGLLADSKEIETAVVFVHGFLGDPAETWQEFQTLVDAHSNFWPNTDLFFFAYDSFRNSVSESAVDVQKFINWVLEPPRELFEIQAGSLPGWMRASVEKVTLREESNRYKKLTLVGHSLGGLVLRKAVWDAAKGHKEAKRRQEDVTPNTILTASIRLFAPALLGARPADLLGLAYELAGLKAVVQAFLGMSKSYLEMKQGSNFLTVVREGTEDMARSFTDLTALRADVLWATSDSVVIDTEYLVDRNCDPLREHVAGTNHVTVCKPTTGYLAPIQMVSHGTL